MKNLLEKNVFEDVLELIDENLYVDKELKLCFNDVESIEDIVTNYIGIKLNEFNVIFKLFSNGLTLHKYISSRMDFEQYSLLVCSEKPLKFIGELRYANPEQFSRKMNDFAGHPPKDIRDFHISVSDNRLKYPFTEMNDKHPLSKAYKSIVEADDSYDAELYLEEYYECQKEFHFSGFEMYHIAIVADSKGILLRDICEEIFHLYCDAMMLDEK